MDMTALVLALAVSAPGDWVVRRTVDPVTDKPSCMISSASAKLALAVDAERVLFVTRSAYTRDGLTIRVDDLEPIVMDYRGRSTAAHKDHARRALEQIKAGSRIRVSFRDYPESQQGHAAIADLPALIASCQ